MMTSDDQELDLRFTYHAPKGDQTSRYEKIRAAGREMANNLQYLCPDSREKSLAMIKLDEVVMWANAAIARRE